MPVLRSSASDFTTYTKASAQTLTQTGKVNKVAVLPGPDVVEKSGAIVKASNVSITVNAQTILTNKVIACFRVLK
jgi:hypothetical protein